MCLMNFIFDNIKKISMALTMAVMGSYSQAQSQDAEPLKLLTEDFVICDEGYVSFYFDVNLDKNENYIIECTPTANGVGLAAVDLIGEASTVDENGVGKNVKFDYTQAVDLSSDKNKKHVRYEFSFVLIYNGSRGNLFHDEYKLNDVLTVDVWGTPKPEIVKPLQDDVCGFSHELEADTRWSDVSSYSWSAGDNITLKDADKSKCKMTLNTLSERSETIVLRESTANGQCYSEDSRVFHFKKFPTGTIAASDNSVQYICTALSNDPAFDFSGDITLAGNGPFVVTLSNGAKYQGLPIGKSTEDIHHKAAGDVSIKTIVDNNGCEAQEDGMSGVIKVVDRVPQLSVPTDTIAFDGREVVLKRELTLTGTSFAYEVDEEFHHHSGVGGVDNIISSERQWLDGDYANYSFVTNKTGLLSLIYTEINEMEDHEDCVNTMRQLITTTASVNAPNGFSPNLDGKNDYLVIQGIPDINHIAVYDQKGKIIFEQDNYRNDWNAEGVEDGYYVYIFEGEGIKTTKETLVIKRNKKK